MVFLVGCFLAGASPKGRRFASKPIVLLVVCIVIGASFLSLKISG